LTIFIVFSNTNAIVIGVIEYNLKFERSALFIFAQDALLIIILFLSVQFIGIYSVPIAHITSLEQCSATCGAIKLVPRWEKQIA